MCKDDTMGSSYQKKCCCCEQGPPGSTGLQGPQGIQGISGLSGSAGPAGPMGAQGNPGPTGQTGPGGQVGPQGFTGQNGQPGAAGPQGPSGANGADGSMGHPGPQGPQGITGPQGTQGIPGRDCIPDHKDCCCERYANVFATMAQIIGAYSTPSDAVHFDSQNAVSSGDFDLSMSNITGGVKFLKSGVYHIQWQLQARITPPVPNPVPSWSFGFWINGGLVPGSIYSGFTQAPGDDACHSTGDIIITISAGDELMLRNTSVSSVNLNPSVTGSVFPITIASVNIECLKSM